MIDCIIICFALAISIKDLNMDISKITKVKLYEITYGNKIMLMTHKEFERWGVGSKDDLIANAKRPKLYYEVVIDGIVFTVPEDMFDEFMKSKIQ